MRQTSLATLPAVLAGLALAAACVVGRPACGQQPAMPAAWGMATPAQSAWRPDLFADYLLTGQTPHPSVARIVAPDEGGVSLGSGVLVDANQSQGLVLTNWHVIRDTRTAVLVQFPDGFQSAGTVIRYDEAWDLAALVIWKPQVAPIQIADRPPQIGEQLTIAGFGRGAYRAQTGPCTDYLSPGTGYTKELVELAATARQGDSGGPILDADGRLAGVLFGQNEGRTIGSCSTRLRAFLGSVGSQGFTPPADTAAIATVPSGISVVPVHLQKGKPRLDASPLVASPEPPVETIPVHAVTAGVPSLATLADFFDVSRNGRTLLAAAGGLAMAILGLRLVIAARPK
jgi:S1-C subfamily serine protease